MIESTVSIQDEHQKLFSIQLHAYILLVVVSSCQARGNNSLCSNLLRNCFLLSSMDLSEQITPLNGWWFFVCKQVILSTDKPKKKPNRFIDSDDEDDDLDDFIDDEDDDIDYSSAIRDIFGYDKSRYVFLCTCITLCMSDLFMYLYYTVYKWPIYLLVLYCVWVTY